MESAPQAPIFQYLRQYRAFIPKLFAMAATLKIDFVSDIACPWCAVGLGALEQALGQLEGQVTANLHFQPFELNPTWGQAGKI